MLDRLRATLATIPAILRPRVPESDGPDLATVRELTAICATLRDDADALWYFCEVAERLDAGVAGWREVIGGVRAALTVQERHLRAFNGYLAAACAESPAAEQERLGVLFGGVRLAG